MAYGYFTACQRFLPRRLLVQDYGAVRPEPLAWFARLAEEQAVDLDSLAFLLEQIPESSLVFRELAATLSARAVELARNQDALETLALLLNNLSVRLSDLGRQEEGLEACEEAVKLYRQLVSSRPDAFCPDLAMSLNNLSIDLTDLGRWEEALAACEEAIKLYRHLATSRPALRPDLAMRSTTCPAA